MSLILKGYLLLNPENYILWRKSKIAIAKSRYISLVHSSLLELSSKESVTPLLLRNTSLYKAISATINFAATKSFILQWISAKK